jgi:hypothetical protein
MATTTKPQFAHDCQDCAFLGNAEVNGNKFDFYHCHRSIGQGTIIYRDGNDPWEYGSCPIQIITPFNYMASLGLSLYLRHLGVNGWTGPKFSGTGFKDNVPIIKVNEG